MTHQGPVLSNFDASFAIITQIFDDVAAEKLSLHSLFKTRADRLARQMAKTKVGRDEVKINRELRSKLYVLIQDIPYIPVEIEFLAENGKSAVKQIAFILYREGSTRPDIKNTTTFGADIFNEDGVLYIKIPQKHGLIFPLDDRDSPYIPFSSGDLPIALNRETIKNLPAALNKPLQKALTIGQKNIKLREKNKKGAVQSQHIDAEDKREAVLALKERKDTAQRLEYLPAPTFIPDHNAHVALYRRAVLKAKKAGKKLSDIRPSATSHKGEPAYPEILALYAKVNELLCRWEAASKSAHLAHRNFVRAKIRAQAAHAPIEPKEKSKTHTAREMSIIYQIISRERRQHKRVSRTAEQSKLALDNWAAIHKKARRTQRAFAKQLRQFKDATENIDPRHRKTVNDFALRFDTLLKRGDTVREREYRMIEDVRVYAAGVKANDNGQRTQIVSAKKVADKPIEIAPVTLAKGARAATRAERAKLAAYREASPTPTGFVEPRRFDIRLAERRKRGAHPQH